MRPPVVGVGRREDGGGEGERGERERRGCVAVSRTRRSQPTPTSCRLAKASVPYIRYCTAHVYRNHGNFCTAEIRVISSIRGGSKGAGSGSSIFAENLMLNSCQKPSY